MENRLSKLIPFTIESANILPCIALFVSNDSSVAPPKVCLTSSLLLMQRAWLDFTENIARLTIAGGWLVGA